MARRNINEKDVERAHVRRQKDLGRLSMKFTSPNRRNVPDRINLGEFQNAMRHFRAADAACLPTEECLRIFLEQMVSFTELKAPGKIATPAQRREHERLRERGFRVQVVNHI